MDSTIRFSINFTRVIRRFSIVLVYGSREAILLANFFSERLSSSQLEKSLVPCPILGYLCFSRSLAQSLTLPLIRPMVCGMTARTTARFSATPFGLPGRLIMSVCL